MKKRRKGFVVKIDRPEEKYAGPQEYYTPEQVERYANSSSMRRIQQKIAKRILELSGVEEGSKLLDLGCGPGHTMEYYEGMGYEVVGVDLNPIMVEKAKEKGLKVIKADMRELHKYFKKGEFDWIVSASALQWLKGKEDLRRVVDGIKHCLKSNGQGVIQFYPKSEEELFSTARVFQRQGLKTGVVIDNPNSPKKRLCFIVFSKVS